MIFLCLLAFIFSACGAAAVAPTPAVSGAAEIKNSTGALGIFPHPYLARFEKLELKEPSGIIFHSGRGTLFVIGDKGHLTELRADGVKEPSLILEVEISGPPNPPAGKIINYFSLPVSDLSGLYYDQPRDRLLVISDDNNVLLHMSSTGEVLDSYALYGEHQEGITLDAEGFLYIAEDSDNLVAKFKWDEAR
jgi:hypothetical protein